MNMKRILVAEDNESNYVLMTYVLRNRYEVVRASNGKEAVELSDQQQFDLIMMDMKMPVMDGLEATRLIKEKHPDLPIIAFTANAFETDRQATFEAGCCDFISKPFSREKCLETIAKYIGE